MCLGDACLRVCSQLVRVQVQPQTHNRLHQFALLGAKRRLFCVFVSLPLRPSRVAHQCSPLSGSRRLLAPDAESSVTR